MVPVVKNPPANAGDVRGVDSIPWVGKIPWRRAWQPPAVFLPGESLDRGAWQATDYGVAKSRTLLSMHACMGPVRTEFVSHVGRAIPKAQPCARA